MEDLPPFEAVERSLSYFRSNNTGFDTVVLGNLKLQSAEKGHVVFTLVLEPHHLNANGNLHGGITAGIIDIVSSFSIASAGCYITGVSTDLNVSYLAASELGDTITIDSTCSRLGKTLAYTTTDVKKGDVILAQGRHTKFVALAFATQNKLQGKSNL
ncbi:HotDog domain-containing protein [Syncephalis fuscata]|nr:HotDog domain-containing protein [Syncephalis fuscata]